MLRRAIRIDRLIMVLGVAVLALGVVVVWTLTHGPGFGPEPPSVSERARLQLREQFGPGVEMRYTERGEGLALCGYARRPGENRDVAFISRSNRLLMGDDPLRIEFEDMQRRVCPGFIQSPGPGR